MIYFDNAATAGFRPQSVINSAMDAIKYMSANPGRSGHALSLKAAAGVAGARRKLKTFVNSESEDMTVFTKNCTEALNLAILGSLKEGGHVVTTANEHNSVLRPLFELDRAKLVKLSVVYPDESGKISAKAVAEKMQENTYLIAVGHVSNVTGATSDIAAIGKLARERGALFLVDGAQSAGHIDIDCQQMNIDMLALAGHKGLLGICGSGALCFSERCKLKPTTFGGTGTNSDSLYQPLEAPEGFESGTLATPAILSLGAGIDYITANKTKYRMQLKTAYEYIYTMLAPMKHVHIRSQKNECGIISVVVDELTSSDVSNILSENYGIAVRGGLHCAPLIHEHLGTTLNGLTRISVSPFNTKADCDALLYALKNIYR